MTGGLAESERGLCAAEGTIGARGIPASTSISSSERGGEKSNSAGSYLCSAGGRGGDKPSSGRIKLDEVDDDRLSTLRFEDGVEGCRPRLLSRATSGMAPESEMGLDGPAFGEPRDPSARGLPDKVACVAELVSEPGSAVSSSSTEGAHNGLTGPPTSEGALPASSSGL